ncbi:hypothetical protein [Acinetobacter calcoaceticus]|uniref:hypothetical protein n=1 Tax=Acinetobacter calcoaceticus TaxID=471 RepID=UPI002856EFAD|nr:hypothetical protein [Acinetobacter calcoaceticus]MDR6796872.1 hypothetical protein [Acinetobacter calcoaceticus]
MKNIIIISGLVLLVSLIFYFYSSNSNIETTTSIHTKKNVAFHGNEPNNAKVSGSSTQTMNTAKNTAPQEEYFMSEVKFNSIMEKGAKNNGVVYVSLSELDPVSRKDAEKALRNLNEKGSLSGGIKQQEFEELDKARETLKEEGIKKIEAKLDSFKGVNDNILNAYNLKLTGAQAFGRYDSNNGWNSVYKLYENNNQKVEVEQSFLKPNESAHQFITESMNFELNNNTPARYERLPSDLIDKVTFVYNSNYYQINGQNLQSDQLIHIANKIIDSQ